MSPLLEENRLRLESQATGSQTALTTATALTMALMVAAYSVPAPAVKNPADVADTLQMTRILAPADEIASQKLMVELLEFQRKLADSQQDLPVEAMQVLTRNLWQLYE